MLKFQKGQDIVEFALMLPFFALIFVGIVYVSFLYSDYMTLCNLARSAARDAVVSEDMIEVPDGAGGTTKERDFSKIKKSYDNILSNGGIKTSLYLYTPGSIDIRTAPLLDDNTNGADTTVKVDIPMVLNRDASLIGALFKAGILTDKNVITEYHVVYRMHDENSVT